jgi:hypothetical protein
MKLQKNHHKRVPKVIFSLFSGCKAVKNDICSHPRLHGIRFSYHTVINGRGAGLPGAVKPQSPTKITRKMRVREKLPLNP